MTRPEDEVAQFFMERKGYPDLQPESKEKLEGHTCWYYVYHLPDRSVLEVEVEWRRETDWSTRVTTFTSA